MGGCLLGAGGAGDAEGRAAIQRQRLRRHLEEPGLPAASQPRRCGGLSERSDAGSLRSQLAWDAVTQQSKGFAAFGAAGSSRERPAARSLPASCCSSTSLELGEFMSVWCRSEFQVKLPQADASTTGMSACPQGTYCVF